MAKQNNHAAHMARQPENTMDFFQAPKHRKIPRKQLLEEK